ncbi:PTS sugar transporter subunit IIB [Fonticella tunisiensis]|uniref:PTS system cellobiose-specific IIB component n=1 Tax=Fonticella tunisiensis TaxID=1096341 RepID=A0A4R7KKY5_9CLOT|nr:PTS sugar transporter subunit IIB [Fonticella tunisiensis]TDT56509.1 PTS system cellobiose-specific IIB component [Fonticella tunisiensis]
MNFDKLRILLVCNLGASTGVMVAKMREVAANSEKLKNIDIKIDARPAGDIKEYLPDYDVVLVGPQIKHRFAELKELCDKYNKPIDVIDTKDYGMVNGANILKTAIVLKVKSERK